MEERSFHPIPNDNGDTGVERYLRDLPPAHYTLKIKSFSALSKLLEDVKEQKYESKVFESGGFKWKLSIYPKGNKEGNGEGHVSMYLLITDTDKLPSNWEVYVNFRLFVYNQIQDKYMAIEDADRKVTRFHKMKTEWGFARLLPLSSFNDGAKGYLVGDKCVFGAEVSVINSSGRGELLDVLEGKSETYTWKINKFSSITQASHFSDVFTLGKQKWKLEINPKGDSREHGKYLSVFICLEDVSSSDRKVYAKFFVCVRNQTDGKHVDIKGTKCFDSLHGSWGSSAVLSLTRLHDASAGFLVNDTLTIDAQIECLFTANNFSK